MVVGLRVEVVDGQRLLFGDAAVDVDIRTEARCSRAGFTKCYSFITTTTSNTGTTTTSS